MAMMMANPCRLHRLFQLTMIVMICQGLLVLRADAFSSLAALPLSHMGEHDLLQRYPTRSFVGTRTCTIGSAAGTCFPFDGRKGHTLRVSNGSRLPRGSGTRLEALPARRASASAFKKVTTRHAWWPTLWTKISAIGHVILGELHRLSWKQRMLMITVFLAGISIGRSLSTLTLARFRDINEIPPIFFGSSASCLKGRAVSVSDGDTFRFYHIPTFFHNSTLDKKTQRLLDHTLLVRLCTIDTPETAKFGKPAQPFAEQAKQELQRLIEDRVVKVRLLTKDQYGRVVGQVMVRPQGSFIAKFFRKNVHVEEVLLQAGLAEVYQGMGAVYGHKGKEYYVNLEKAAQQSKKGMWALSKRESAADYKRRTKNDK